MMYCYSCDCLQYGEVEWTLWDRFEFPGDPTLQEVVDWFQKNHNLEVSMASQGVVMLWSPFISKAKVRFHAQTVNSRP